MGMHRMFTLAVVDTDKFNDMPISARLLYYELGMRADDDGFISSPKKIVKMIGCTVDDLKLLITNGFVIYFKSGVIVITHWNMHNIIRKDRKKDTFFQEEKALLNTDKNNVYTLISPTDNQMTTKCQPLGSEMSAQDKLSKDKLSKDNIESILLSTDVDGRNAFDYQSVINSFNSVCISLPKVQKITDKRKRQIKNASNLLGEVTFTEFFKLVQESDFLSGRTGKWNGCCFDWIINPTNLTKIIEGNYKNKAVSVARTSTRNYEEEF